MTAGLVIAVLVVVSARVRGFQGAHQLGGVVVLPVVLLLVAQLLGAIVLDARLAVLIGAVVWATAATVLLVAPRGFRRDRLLRQV